MKYSLKALGLPNCLTKTQDLVVRLPQASRISSFPKVQSRLPAISQIRTYIKQFKSTMSPSDHEQTQDQEQKIPYTGWDGEVPSKEGRDYEPDFIHKPPYDWNSSHFHKKWEVSCYCGNVAFEFASEPVDAKYCHCHTCQRLHGAAFQWAVLFFKTTVRMTKNVDNTVGFWSTSNDAPHKTHYVPCKVSCTNCQSPLFDEGRNMVLAFPSAFKFQNRDEIPESFKPKNHIFYKERIMDIHDGLPKWKAHVGGTEIKDGKKSTL